MSTSISYKGQVIASFGNSTKTLNTAGTWLEDDITVTATDSSAAVTTIQELDEHGGIIKHINAIDLSNDTVDAAHLLQGYTAHDRDGNAVTGTYTGGSGGGTTINNQNKTVTPTEFQQSVTADTGYTGLGTVTVNAIPTTYVGSGVTQKTSSDLTVSGATVTAPAGYYAAAATKSIASGSAQTPATTLTINPSITVNSSGLITVSASTLKAITPTVTAGYVSSGSAGTVTVSVSNTSQLSTQASTTIAPTESTQTAVASGKYTTGDVKIGAIPTTYVGSGVTQRTSSNLSVSGATVTAPAGYYAAAATKSVASGSAQTPNTTISVTPTISVNSSGLITVSASTTKNITPTVTAGYVSSGSTGTVTVSGSNTSQLSTQAATTYNVSSSNQTISSGKYLTGNQTIRGVTVSGLAASNIANGVTVKVGDAADDDRITSVTGTLSFVSYYTGSGDPSSSLGQNNDIYLKVVS